MATTTGLVEGSSTGAIRERLRRARVTWTGQFEGLTVFALEMGGEGCPVPGVLLDDGLARGATVSEVSEREAPGAVAVRNPLAEPLVVLDGDLLTGGSHDRVADATVVVGPGATLEVPVSCVERERREAPQAGLALAPWAAPPYIRRRKTCCAARSGHAGEARPDPVLLWEDVIAYHLCLSGRAKGGPLAAAFRARAFEVERYSGAVAIPADVPADGIAAAVGGRVVALEAFGSRELLRAYAPRGVRGYALDALLAACLRQLGAGGRSAERAARQDLVKLLDDLACAPEGAFRLRPSRGGGVDLRLASERATGSGLVFEGHLVAFAAFPLGGE